MANGREWLPKLPDVEFIEENFVQITIYSSTCTYYRDELCMCFMNPSCLSNKFLRIPIWFVNDNWCARTSPNSFPKQTDSLQLSLHLFPFVLIEVVSCWCCEMFVWLTEFSTEYTQYYFPNACSEFMISKWFIEDTEDDKQTNKKSPLWRRVVTNGTDEGEREKWRKQKQVMKYEVVTVCCSFSLRSFCVQLPVVAVSGHLSHLARNTNGAVVTSTSLRTIYLQRC